MTYIAPDVGMLSPSIPDPYYTIYSKPRECSNQNAIADGSFTNESSTRQAQSFKYFLRLPRELRDQIYQHNLITDGYIQHPAKHEFQVTPRLGVNVLRTCRQIHHEAIQVLYGRNTLQIRPFDRKRGRPGVDWLDKLGAQNCASIKTIEIVTRNLAKYTYGQLEKICKSLPNLTRMVMVIFWMETDDFAKEWLRIRCLLTWKPKAATMAWDTRDRIKVERALARAFPPGYIQVNSRFIQALRDEAAWVRIRSRRNSSHPGSWATQFSEDEDELYRLI